MTRETADIVIVGAGIIGLSCALQLSRRNNAKIIVLEKGIGLGAGSTGASSAVCRTKYSLDQTVTLAKDGIEAYRNWAAFLETSNPLAVFHETGVLWMGDGLPRSFDAEFQRLKGLGVAVDVLDDLELAQRFPAINPCPVPPDLVYGEPHDCAPGGPHLLELQGGYVDPMDALQDLLGAVRARGVDVRFDTMVTGASLSGGAIKAIQYQSGEIATGTVVNAAGPWCNMLNGMVGLECPWPLLPTRIQIVHIDRPDTVVGSLPVCADPQGGIYFRPQNRGQQIVVGSVLQQDEQEYVDPDDFDRSVDDDFARVKLHALQHRVRGLDRLSGIAGYSGLYTINDSDVHPVVGRTDVKGFFVANGFSGHGFKLAPAIGSLVAQAVTGLRVVGDTSVDLDFLAFNRAPIEISTRSVLG